MGEAAGPSVNLDGLIKRYGTRREGEMMSNHDSKSRIVASVERRRDVDGKEDGGDDRRGRFEGEEGV